MSPGACSSGDESACRAAQAAIQTLYDQVNTCSPGDACVPVNSGIEGAPRCANSFRCPLAVKQGTDLSALGDRLRTVDEQSCQRCGMCPLAACIAPAPVARCGPLGRCELVR